MKPWAILVSIVALPASAVGQPRSHIRSFLEAHCVDCHDPVRAKGGLDLSGLPLDLASPRTFATWTRVYDRVQAGEMPPAGSSRPRSSETTAFMAALVDPLIAADRAREAAEGRATRRRLNRYEYENTLRDLFQAPWLQVRDILPEDGEAFRFNKVGDALDVSHVQVAQCTAAAEHAMRAVLAAERGRPASTTTRYHARDMRTFTRLFGRPGAMNAGIARNTFPVLGFAAQPEVRARKAPLTVGSADPVRREQEGVGIVHGSYEPVEPKFDAFKAPRSGRYRLRLNAHSIWVGPQKSAMWWVPDMDSVSRGCRPEPITLYAERPPGLLRRLGSFDVGPDPTTGALEVLLLEGETIRPDAARFFRSRPARNPDRPLGSAFRNPLATREGQPGVSLRWLEVEGPISDETSSAGRVLMFGDLPVTFGERGAVEVTASDPAREARALLAAFLRQAYRRSPRDTDLEAPWAVTQRALGQGVPFAEAMLAGYQTALCSPDFLYLDEAPGPLDDHALASRLSYFLWNSPPDEALRASATAGALTRPEGLRAQAQRLLAAPRARRFVEAFLDYWLELRRLRASSPDAVLYPDYALDELLLESALQETQLFFAELLRRDLPARNVIDSDFVIVNERLAAHYGLRMPRTAGLGVDLKRVPLPPGSPRGGILTQASVLKVTANGTTTSPVVRGAWVSERLLGVPVPPPPAGVPAVEPDIRGAATIREQLEKHRSDKTCASCHSKIDPPGFALESFDVFGGWRRRYRALGESDPPLDGFGMDGIRFEFHEALPVDPAGVLPSGARFRGIADLKRALLRDERQIARNLVNQLVVFATGAPVRFGDRARVEAILDRAARRRYGVRTLILAIVESDLFRHK